MPTQHILVEIAREIVGTTPHLKVESHGGIAWITTNKWMCATKADIAWITKDDITLAPLENTKPTKHVRYKLRDPTSIQKAKQHINQWYHRHSPK